MSVVNLRHLKAPFFLFKYEGASQYQQKFVVTSQYVFQVKSLSSCRHYEQSCETNIESGKQDTIVRAEKYMNDRLQSKYHAIARSSTTG